VRADHGDDMTALRQSPHKDPPHAACSTDDQAMFFHPVTATASVETGAH
jgi:hypothetical protein